MRRLLPATLALLIAVPIFATEPNPSKRQRELAEKLLTTMNIDETTRSTIDAMYERIEKQILESAAAEGNDADAIAEAKETFRSFRQKAAKLDLGGELHESYVHIYSKYFSEAELADLITFYSSPTGRKSIEVLPQLMQEGMDAGMQHLAPAVQQAMREALDEQEQKRPWRKTMADMRTIAVAVEAYATDHDEYPSGDYDSLKPLLEPTYVKTMPSSDMWKHPYAYVASDDHQHYRIVSAGADAIFEWDSRRIAPVKEGQAQPDTVYRDRLEDDLIFADGSFIQAPVQAKEKAK